MSPRKPEAKKATSKAAARKKLALSKETLRDLTARDRAKGVRGGRAAPYTWVLACSF